MSFFGMVCSGGGFDPSTFKRGKRVASNDSPSIVAIVSQKWIHVTPLFGSVFVFVRGVEQILDGSFNMGAQVISYAVDTYVARGEGKTAVEQWRHLCVSSW